MKNIELTEDHKSKLLEMCKELFPKLNLEMYYDDDIADNWKEALENNSCGNDAQVGYLISNWHKPNAKIIHWFEFCITEIVNELAWRNIKTDILADCEYEDFRMKLIIEIFRDKFTTETFHIVDYLYKEFKQLK